MRFAMLAWCAALVAAPAGAMAATGGSYAATAAAESRPLPPAQRMERHFLQVTAASLRFQSEGARLALARSNNPAVKDLARAALARQQTEQPQLQRLLQARGMAMPFPGNEHGKLLKQLGRLNGAKFDRLYVDEVVLRSCQTDIANLEKMALQAQDPVLKAWVERQLPTLRLHFAKAGKALAQAQLRGQRDV
jgi:putative membrane protein